MKKKRGDLQELLLDIENSGLNTVNRSPVNRTFELFSHPFLVSDLSGWIGTFTIRAILYELHIDEHRIFKWRPENKFIQYLIFKHYSHGCMPITLGLTSVLKDEDWVAGIRKLIKSGHFIKATLGFGSGRRKNFDRTAEFEQILKQHQEEPFLHEKWVIQRKLKLNKEFRVHTFGKDILYGLTFKISGPDSPDDFDGPQEFIRLILQKLPSSFLEGDLIGWDIGLTRRGKYYVIEANFTGFHPEYRAGFQTTGYVDEMPFGPIICAWINSYFRNKYAVSIFSVDNDLLVKFPFLEELLYYISIFKDEHIEALNKAKGGVAAAYIYLGEKTEFLLLKLISYLHIAKFANVYYIITSRKLQAEAKNLFKGDNITHLAEEELLPEDLYGEIEQLSEEGKKEIYCDRAVMLTKETSYIII